MLYGLVMCIHVIVCFMLIGVILLQAGKGGLADSFGGGAAQSMLGTSAGTFLTKATTGAAVMFIVTCISLTLISSSRSASLMSGMQPGVAATAPIIPTATPDAPLLDASGMLEATDAAVVTDMEQATDAAVEESPTFD
jgi:preprotein translocase subunit SecG